MKSRPALPIALVLGPVIAGLSTPISQGAYEIQRGDTLTKIAIAKYGDLEKWKEIFELNKAQIRDPHWIYPGQRLRFMPDEKLTFVASSRPIPMSRKRSQEWRLLPKQNWEKFAFPRDPYLDPSGLDRRSTVGRRFSNQTIAPMTISPDRIPIAGEITGSRSLFPQIPLGETVLIRADEAMQVGSVYSITSGPEKLSSPRDGRVGFAYSILGKMKVIGVRDGMFIGTVVALYHPVLRGNLLIPDVAPIPIPNPKPCPSPLNASAWVSKLFQKNISGQGSLIFLDVGSQDGVTAGMIFRHYQNTDFHTGSKFPTRDFMIESEVMVISPQEQFSTALVLRSRSGLRHEDELVGLTDLTDFDRNQGLQRVLQDHAKTLSPDELDLLDSTDGLGEKEMKELKQLESWSKQTPSEGTGAGLPQDEIRREIVNPSGRPVGGIGDELGPNDASGTGIPGAPTTAPESNAPPSDEVLPEPAKEEVSPAPATEPAPVQEPAGQTGTSAPSPAASPTPSPALKNGPGSSSEDTIPAPPSIDSSIE